MTLSIVEEIGYERVSKLMGEAIANAARETAALGLPDAVKIDGVWLAKYPDGRLSLLRDAPAKDK